MTKAELTAKLEKMSGSQLRLFFGMGEFEGVPDEKVRRMALAFFGMNMMLDPATVPHRSSKSLMPGCKMHNRAKDAANAECTSCGASRGVICAEYEESTEAAKPGSAIKRVGTPATGLASALSPHRPVDTRKGDRHRVGYWGPYQKARRARLKAEADKTTNPPLGG